MPTNTISISEFQQAEAGPEQPQGKGHFSRKVWGSLMLYHKGLGQTEDQARASVAALSTEEGYALFGRRRGQFGAVMAIQRRLGVSEVEARAAFANMDVDAAAEFIKEHESLLNSPENPSDLDATIGA